MASSWGPAIVCSFVLGTLLILFIEVRVRSLRKSLFAKHSGITESEIASFRELTRAYREQIEQMIDQIREEAARERAVSELIHKCSPLIAGHLSDEQRMEIDEVLTARLLEVTRSALAKNGHLSKELRDLASQIVNEVLRRAREELAEPARHPHS